MERTSRGIGRNARGALAIAIVASITAVCPAMSQTRTAEPFAWSGTLAPGSTLEVKGVNGGVRAVAESGRTASLEATRTARRNDPEEVEIVVVEHEGGVTICAVYPSTGARANECAPGDGGRLSAGRNDTEVAFTVRVPESVDFIGRSTNGDVSVRGVTDRVEAISTNGDVEVDGGSDVRARTTNGSVSIRGAGFASARTTNGEITAELPGFASTPGTWSFSTTNGPITLRLPAGTNAEIDASTTNGRITSDLPVTVSGTIGRDRLRGTLGTGGPLIELRTTNGRIDLARIP